MHVLHCTRHAGSIFHYANSANITLCVGLVSYGVGLHCLFFSNDSNNNLYAAPSFIHKIKCSVYNRRVSGVYDREWEYANLRTTKLLLIVSQENYNRIPQI